MTSESSPVPIAVVLDSTSALTNESNRSQLATTLHQFAHEQHWQIVATIERNPERPGNFVHTATTRVLALAEAGSIRKVLAKTVPCVGRRCSLALQFLRDLHTHGVSFYWHSRGIETLHLDGSLSADGSLILALLDEMARAENARHSERILKGLASARDRGKTLGRPSGTTDSTEAILDRYSEVVRHLEEGLSLRETARLADVAQGTVQRVKKAMRREGRTITAATGLAPDTFEGALPVELL